MAGLLCKHLKAQELPQPHGFGSLLHASYMYWIQLSNLLVEYLENGKTEPSLASGLVSPQFHVPFDPSFQTVKRKWIHSIVSIPGVQSANSIFNQKNDFALRTAGMQD